MNRGVRPPQTLVDELLTPWRQPPVPPAGLLLDGATYLPSSQRMSPEIGTRFRGLAWDLIERSTTDEGIRQRALAAVDELLGRVEGEVVPGRRMRDLADAEIVEMYCELVRVVTGVRDPYAALKRHYNEQALQFLPALQQVVAEPRDPEEQIRRAINLGIIGNAIDFADPTQKVRLDHHGFDMAKELRQAVALRYVVDERSAFLAAWRGLSPQGTVPELLFLADNAGEIIFDLPLIKRWLSQGRRVTLVGKSVPCYNDLTAEELRELVTHPAVRGYLGQPAPLDHGLTGPVAVIPSGTATIGLDLRRATPELVAAWQRAAIIYAKGQGMLQTLRYAPLTREVFHAVQVKDPAYFHEGVPLKAGDALFLHTRRG